MTVLDIARIVTAELRKRRKKPEQTGRPARPELQKDANGLWPGQQHPLDIPDFLRRTPRPPTSSEAPQGEAALQREAAP